MATTSPPVSTVRKSSGRLYLALGILLVLVGPILWMVQVFVKQLQESKSKEVIGHLAAV